MKIVIEIDTTHPMSDKDKLFLDVINELVNGKKLIDDQEEEKVHDDTPPQTEVVEEPKQPAVSTTRRKPVYKEKICVDCKQPFIPKGGRTTRCPDCVSKKKTEDKPSTVLSVDNTASKKPKMVACRNCHKPYVPAEGDHNFYCPKCIEKLRNRPKISPTKIYTLTVEEVLRLPVVDRYKHAYMWSYADRQRALALKPVYPKLSKEEEEFFRRCATGDFMED